MRLLADGNFPRPIVEALRADGHDVRWARTDWAGWKDVVLLDLAESEARIVLTLDKDFWQIAVQRRIPVEQSGVVLFRVHPATPENLEPLVRALVEANRAGKDAFGRGLPLHVPLPFVPVKVLSREPVGVR